MSAKIGFIGLGAMGLPMAKNLISAGFQLAVTTSSAEKADRLQALGAFICESPRDVAAAAEIIVTCVPDGKALRTLITGEVGIAADGWSGGLLIDCSTIAPSDVLEIAEVLADAGATIVDAPVSGGVKGAESASLAIVCGGSDEDVERAMSVLKAMGKAISHVGGPSAGQVVKACNQLMISVTMMGVYEAMALARGNGVDPAVMRDALSTGSARSGVLDAHALRYLEGQLDGGFRMQLMVKDLGIAAALGDVTASFQPAGSLAFQLFKAASANGFAKLDSAALGSFYDQMNGAVD